MPMPSKKKMAMEALEQQRSLALPIPSSKNIDFKMPPAPELYPEQPMPATDPDDPDGNDYWRCIQCGHNGRARIFQFNVENVLENTRDYAGALAYDKFEHKVKILRPIPGGGKAGDSFSEQHLFAFRVRLEQNLGESFPPGLLLAGVKAAALRNPRHVVRDYLERLSWDDQPRLESLGRSYFGATPSDYVRAVFKRFLIAAVARAYDPGCKVDTVLVLEGPQGSRKSTAIKGLFLVPKWVNDTPLDLRSKDAHINIQGKWCIELAELDSLSSADSARVKAFLSLDSDTFRVPYETQVKEFPRSCIFIGTVNESAYLMDTSGGRRFWPVVTGEIDLHALVRDRDQLWAEAVHLYKSGEQWHLSHQEEVLAQEEQDRRRLESPMEAPIRAYISTREDVTITEILDKAMDMRLYKASGREGRMVSQVLSGVFGWRRTKVLRDGARVNGFARPVGDIPASHPPSPATPQVEDDYEPGHEPDDSHDKESGD